MIMLVLASIASTLALIATIIAVYSRDVAKTIIIAGIESVFTQ